MSLNSLSLDHSLWGLLTRFFVNLVVLFIIIRLIYYRYSKKEEFLFSYFVMGIMIFFITSVLETIDIQIGMALGLFAIFAILRFRTINLSVKEMTYIFTVIGVSVINSQARIAPPVLGAIIVNSIIIITLLLLEIYLQKRTYNSFIVIYHKTDLLAPDNMNDLLTNLSRQTGQKIEKANILRMNTHNGNTEVEVFFLEKNINKEETTEA